MDKYHLSHCLKSEDYCELSAHKNKSENSHKFFATSPRWINTNRIYKELLFTFMVTHRNKVGCRNK